MIVQNVQPESPISPAQNTILIINRSISLQTRNADCDIYKINLPNSQFSISFIESRPSELELSPNPSERDQRLRSESKRERPSKAKIAMDSAARRSTAGGGIFEGLYKVLMRRNSIYVTFVVVGAYFGERVSLFNFRISNSFFLLRNLIRKTRKIILSDFDDRSSFEFRSITWLRKFFFWKPIRLDYKKLLNITFES